VTTRKPIVLLVDDEASLLGTLRILLKDHGFQPETAQGGKAGLEALTTLRPDIVLTDVRMPYANGIQILEAAKAQDPDVPVVLMTAYADLQVAIDGLNKGALFYIQKPFANDELLAILRRAAEHRQLRAENRDLRREIQRRERSSAVEPIGVAKGFVDVLQLARQVAPTESTVLVLGESGTGKEVLARYIHELSERAEGPFMSINCGALPESLLESELFGHVKGSFTGAVRDKEGLFAAAGGGTFFLDEIAEMSPATQVKLLRVLQEREALPVGGTEPIPVDVRLIAATNRDLDEELRQGRFRSDLYYRLNVIALRLPPLRDRPEDIPLLAEAFLERLAHERGQPVKRLSPAALEALLACDWPGNVRELENALEHAVLLTSEEEVGPDALPERSRSRKATPIVSERMHTNPTLEAIERAYIQWVLESEGGNKSRAAEVLGIDPSTLYRKLARYEGHAPRE
jgi:DNA-binding NtrC family response regulator